MDRDFPHLGKKKDPGSLFLALAREAVEVYALRGEVLDVSSFLEEPFQKKGGVFVSLKKEGELRGCIGTVIATKPDLAQEIVTNAISAAFKDPRFSPVRIEELPLLTYSIDILRDLEEVQEKDLNPVKYGILVKKGLKRGLLLPDLKGIDTVKKQLAIVCQKAGITSQKEMVIYRFQVDRYQEGEESCE